MPYAALFCLIACLIHADAPARPVGEFTSMRYTAEHAYGYSMQLWRAGGSLFGLFLSSDGLAGDTPTGRLQRLTYEPSTGRLTFNALLSLGSDPRGSPTRDRFEFEGKLSADRIAGVLTRRSTTPDRRRVILRAKKEPLSEFRTVGEWERWARSILQRRGPLWAVDAYLASDLDLKEALYPEGYTPIAIGAKEAVRFAVDALESRGVRDVRICQIDWIAAPLGAAIIQAAGQWTTGGATFDAFAVGIRDGTEIKYGLPGGQEFMLLARGVNAKGEETYYHSGEEGVQAEILPYSSVPEEERDLLFEFVDRDRLTSLPKRCGKSR
jgi:hypothetical protein